MSGLEIAGLVLGGVGSVSGFVALVFTYRVTRIEEDRRRDELRPSLGLAYYRESGVPCLRIHNAGPVDVDLIEIEETSEHPKVVTGFVIGGATRWSGSVGGVRVGDAVTVAVASRPRGRGGALVVRLRCHHRDLRWTIVQRCDVPDERGPTFVTLDSVLDRAAAENHLTGDPGRVALIGVDDDLDRDEQELAGVDLEATGGLVVLGTFASGKTTLLRTIALGMASQAPASVVQIYALDFTGWSLGSIADLPHCAAAVRGDDVERAARALTILANEVARREAVLASAGVGSLGELRAREQSMVPRIVVLVDGYGQFRRTFDETDRYQFLSTFGDIVAKGRRVGVHCVITATTTFDVLRHLDSTVSGRIVLRMGAGESPASLGLTTDVSQRVDLSALPDGRGYLRGTAEVQVACVGTDPSGAAQDAAIAAAAVRLAAADAARAPALPELPAHVVLDGSSAGPLTAPLGVADLTLEPVHVDLAHRNFVVLGPPMSGRSSTLATIASGLRASSGSGLYLAVLGGPESPLATLDVWDRAAFARAAHTDLLAKLVDTLDDTDTEPRVVLFVDTAEEIDGDDIVTPLDALLRHEGLRAAVACEPATLSSAYRGWLATLRHRRTALVLQPESRNAVDTVVDVRPRLRPEQPFPPGRGILVEDRRWSLIQVGHAVP